MTDRFIFRGQDLEGNTLRYGQLTIIEAENIHPPKEFYISNKSNMLIKPKIIRKHKPVMVTVVQRGLFDE